MSPPSKTSRTKIPFSKRPVKSNPLLHSMDHDRERRRNLFLKKVREQGEDRKWKARGGEEEIMRSIYVSEQKRWEATQARIAREILAPQEEDEDLSMAGPSNPIVTQIINDPLSEENAELEALVSLWESQRPAGNASQTSAPPNSSSDDEEYDRLFLDLINQEYSGQVQEFLSEESGNMDTSSG
ncbi:MAG: hypothetical protein M1839_008746 [Geoglossum umbratile]|nr:MAG: hypothetical protein M1839_008746 [Geoglossum umbratile]